MTSIGIAGTDAELLEQMWDRVENIAAENAPDVADARTTGALTPRLRGAVNDASQFFEVVVLTPETTANKTQLFEQIFASYVFDNVTSVDAAVRAGAKSAIVDLDLFASTSATLKRSLALWSAVVERNANTIVARIRLEAPGATSANAELTVAFESEAAWTAAVSLRAANPVKGATFLVQPRRGMTALFRRKVGDRTGLDALKAAFSVTSNAAGADALESIAPSLLPFVDEDMTAIAEDAALKIAAPFVRATPSEIERVAIAEVEAWTSFARFTTGAHL